MNSTWDIPVGRERKFGCDMPLWADAIVGGWTVSTIFQARSGPHLTPYFVYGTDPIYPANTGRRLDGVGQFGEAWRPDVSGNPNIGGTRERFFDLTVFTLPARRARSATRRRAASTGRARGSSTSRSTRTSSGRAA